LQELVKLLKYQDGHRGLSKEDEYVQRQLKVFLDSSDADQEVLHDRFYERCV
jgi:hypothetical protein